MQKSNRWSDLQLEQIIGGLLRGGVVLAAAVVFLGAIPYLLHHGKERPDYHTFYPIPENLHTISGVMHQVLALNGEGIIQFGLLLLVLTPISRVAFSAVGFLLERDWMYLVITFIVLGILLFSLLRAA
jgi:uncharacterized membrane protein